MTDASEMLAAALERMDGIIAGSKALGYFNGLYGCQSPTSPLMGGLQILHLLEDLRGALEIMDPEERERLRCQIPEPTAETLAEWLQGPLANGHNPSGDGDLYLDRLARLETNRESLVLQVSVLTDQVEAQGEKIRDLDLCLEEHREKLNATEDMLQQELLSRTTLETQKLDLLAELSSLKLELTAMEKGRLDYEQRLMDKEDLIQEVIHLKTQVREMENERLQYEKNLQSTKGELVAMYGQPEGSSGKRLQDETQLRGTALEGADSVEGEKKVKDGDIEESCQDDPNAVSNNVPVSVETETDTLPSVKEVTQTSPDELVMCVGPLPVSTPKPEDTPKLEQARGPELAASDGSPNLTEADSMQGKNVDQKEACKEVTGEHSPPLKSPATAGPTEDGFGTKKARSSFGRGFFKIRRGKRAASAPDLAETECERTEQLDLGLPHQSPSNNSTHTLPCTPERKKSSGIRKLFGKLKRSHSTSFNLDNDVSVAEFKRGGVRATAGPRLGWSPDQQGTTNEVDAPFGKWSREQVCSWLQELGLGVHMGVARQWITSGQTLLQASQQDLDRELGIKHALHRKKLKLALQALISEEDDSMGKLNCSWVTRWLDDIGLPQYKTHFEEGRVDGRMIHYMTVDDLLSLKVSSVLHHLSIKRAIQVLRLNNYQPDCLRRRPSDEGNVTPAEVSQWTNHRVMEWLRSVDLAEYAPNLRGSGVHGALMVLEPRFTVETLALLLNIPPSKTLLRRHLVTHFHLLVGPDAQHSKQEHLECPEYTPLTATAKVKPRKLSFGSFGSLRKRRQEESEEYVCPMDVEMPWGASFQRSHGSLDLRLYGDDLEQLEQMEDSEGTVRQIGAFSEGINNLTSLLKKDEFLREMPTCSPSGNTTEDSDACGQQGAAGSDSANTTH
ncbi:liprin-beta-1-like [Megalops cyprinoides]|uniref:liprin-beta-1-like n=1 Tax=Megalops cyprinoides TaxID=118141 RepID=UPI0018641351|nr:liprin-beta-1-like [Megalops cyprinoides]